MITDIKLSHAITMRLTGQIHNNITVGVQTVVHNNNVTEVNNTNQEIKIISNRMTDKHTIIEEIAERDPLAEVCNLLGEPLVITEGGIELERVRKRQSLIQDILNKTQETAGAQHV